MQTDEISRTQTETTFDAELAGSALFGTFTFLGLRVAADSGRRPSIAAPVATIALRVRRRTIVTGRNDADV